MTTTAKDIMDEALLVMTEMLKNPFFSRPRKFPKSYCGAPPRRKVAKSRARKRALYAAITGRQYIKIRVPNNYVSWVG